MLLLLYVIIRFCCIYRWLVLVRVSCSFLVGFMVLYIVIYGSQCTIPWRNHNSAKVFNLIVGYGLFSYRSLSTILILFVFSLSCFRSLVYFLLLIFKIRYYFLYHVINLITSFYVCIILTQTKINSLPFF